MPKHVVVLDELPRTASGKVRKADLRARFGGSGVSPDARSTRPLA
jgi:fatty-acyl-CoA synthase